MAKKRIKFMDTSFRDGFQSVYGARVLTKDFLPALEAAVEAGITHFESGGGARFQSLYFYCQEDAFDMMDTFRKTVGPDIQLQTLARGVNVVGLESQSSDIIDLHAKMFKKHGITTIRNFDALNDINNLLYSGQCIVNAGLKHEVTITMMELPPGCEGAHTPEFYINILNQILDSGLHFDSICFKDASGTSSPKKVFDTIKAARERVGKDVHIVFHSHETAGCSVVSHKAALDAGATGLDLAMSPVSGGTCHPDIITMWHALKGTDYDLGVDINKILKAEAVFEECMKDYFMPPESRKVTPEIVFSPLPGGAYTANTQMMRDNGTLDKLPEVIAAMSEVVKKGGFGTSVTPVSQFYFQQAYANVMSGAWKKITPGYGKMVLGYFGKTPVAPDAEIVKLASEQLGLEPTTKTVLELNDADPKKGIKYNTQLLKDNGLPVTDENIFIVATCQDKGIDFLKGEKPYGVRKLSDEAAKSVKPLEKADAYTVTLGGKAYDVHLDGAKATVNGKSFDFTVAPLKAGSASNKAAKSSGGDIPVISPLPGTLVRLEVKVGDQVNEGDVLFVVEAMKMESDVKASASGTVKEILVDKGAQLKTDDKVMVLN
ncbi:MAG: biotin/lipoyl-binding protein [Candidatus Riflebacteria bacterium]|nr:biotin/lipoyl-binding protein [Candidatus Riflebacteria bacterium]